MSLTPTKVTSDELEHLHATTATTPPSATTTTPEPRSSARGLMSQLSWTFGRKSADGSSPPPPPPAASPASTTSLSRLTPSNRQMSWKFGLHSSSHSRSNDSVDGRSNHSRASSSQPQPQPQNHHRNNNNTVLVMDHDHHQQHDLDGLSNTTRSDLEEVIANQDANITALEKARLEKQQELAALQKELYEERLLQMKDSILHQIETERLQRQTKAVKELLAALEKDMQDKDAIHEYANLIKGVAPKGGVDSQYVMKLQSQLAKAVKKMDATSQQMTLLEQSCDEVVASLKNEISDIVEERCRTELDLRRQLEQLEDQRAELKAAYEERIRENRREIERLKHRAQTEGAPVDVYKELEEAEHRLLQLSLPQETNTPTSSSSVNQTVLEHDKVETAVVLENIGETGTVENNVDVENKDVPAAEEAKEEAELSSPNDDEKQQVDEQGDEKQQVGDSVETSSETVEGM